MRISFVSDERPRRIAKALKNRLAALGHDLPFAKVREATAGMFGYRSWNDLLGQCGRSQPSPGDQDVSAEEAAERRRRYVERLASGLNLPIDVAAAAVDEVGPTSRRRAAFDLDAAIQRMARNLSARGPIEVRIQPSGASTTKPSEGFRLGNDLIDQLLVCDDGSLSNGKVMIGRMLQGAGLLEGGAAEVEPDPMVERTLKRLDRKALRLLRAVPHFSSDAYEIARGLTDGSPFVRLVDELPMLAAEIEHLAHARRNALRETDDLREDMILSGEPMQRYLDVVGRFAVRKWPGIPFDRKDAERTVRAVGGIAVLEDLGLQPWHVAFLALVPDSKLPRSPRQMVAAMRFAEAWTGAFSPQDLGMTPAAFDSGFDGDWVAIQEEARASAYTLTSAFGEIAADVTALHAMKSGVDLDRALERPVEGILARRVRDHLVPGRGLLEICGLIARYHANLGEQDGPEGPGKCYRAMIASGVLGDVADAEPSVVISRLGLSPKGYLEALLDGSEATLGEVEARISTVAPTGENPDADVLVGSRTFHEVEIGGLVLKGVLSADGPCIVAQRQGERVGGVAMGNACSIEEDDDGQWFVAKYGGERRIELAGFGQGDVLRLSREFGIVVGEYSAGWDSSFYESPAVAGLRRYILSHPRIAEIYADRQQYLPGWYTRLLRRVAPTSAL